jgi:hypothetical protein
MAGAAATLRKRSVDDLFGGSIVLRDMDPRGGVLAASESERSGKVRGRAWPPRKRDPGYADVLLELIGRYGEPGAILYVGDSLPQDGAAIRGLRKAGPPGRVWGFICRPAELGTAQRNEIVDGVFLGCEWSTLSAFVEYAQEDGLVFGPNTWALFDLDCTVYAAKGREEKSLEKARSEAVRTFVQSTIPGVGLEPARVEDLYREFEQDRFHGLTEDNLDHVVALVLATMCGLTDVGAMRGAASSGQFDFVQTIERMLSDASGGRGREAPPGALNALEEVYLGALAGDPTPCKGVRRHEALATAARMLPDAAGRSRIHLNREVIDLLGWAVAAGGQILAVSDRPTEATVVINGDEVVDLMAIPMAVRGRPLRSVPLRRG